MIYSDLFSFASSILCIFVRDFVLLVFLSITLAWGKR